MGNNFGKCLTFTLQFEGGWSDNPRDPGGPTNKGITLATYCQYLGKPATRADLRCIPFPAVATIYKTRYWHAVDGDNLEPGTDLLAFDIAVNMGVGRATEFLRRTNNLPPRERILRLHALRMGFWRRLRSWVTFGRGWSRREAACLKMALQMAGG